MIMILTYIPSRLNKYSQIFNQLKYILLILQIEIIIHNQTLLKKYSLTTFRTHVQSVCLYYNYSLFIIFSLSPHKIISPNLSENLSCSFPYSLVEGVFVQ